MRPGTLSVHTEIRQKREYRSTNQLHTQGRSRSEYVRPENLEVVRREIEAYKRFKTILTSWSTSQSRHHDFVAERVSPQESQKKEIAPLRVHLIADAPDCAGSKGQADVTFGVLGSVSFPQNNSSSVPHVISNSPPSCRGPTQAAMPWHYPE